MVQDIVGYSDVSPLPLDPFMKQEIRLEKEAFEREAKEGLHPNPPLCRVCRKLRVVLEPYTNGGWKWNAKVNFMPYGHYHQIFMRQGCAVCSLLLRIVHCDDRLHPMLATIDPEVQGFALKEREMDDMEKMLNPGCQTLKVGYGRKDVGTLNILGSTSNRLCQELPLRRLKEALRQCNSGHSRQYNRQALASRLSIPIDMLQIDMINKCAWCRRPPRSDTSHLAMFGEPCQWP